MAVIGDIYKREINGELRDVEAVSAFMGIYKNPLNGFWYAVDWKHNHRAAFQTPELARKWIRTANKAFCGLPATNLQYSQFNQNMKSRGWRVVQLLGNCQVWEECRPPFDAGGYHYEVAGAT